MNAQFQQWNGIKSAQNNNSYGYPNGSYGYSYTSNGLTPILRHHRDADQRLAPTTRPILSAPLWTGTQFVFRLQGGLPETCLVEVSTDLSHWLMLILTRPDAELKLRCLWTSQPPQPRGA